ncbi:hypothetical protein ACIBHX_12800 [Nonomuraea sp. NPDC050536]|uniref:hypothetical protein n=1 Tax=Nonomuraea sp. NPDC050536 TaxID=3364366 RepID=UPI0037C73485
MTDPYLYNGQNPDDHIAACPDCSAAIALVEADHAATPPPRLREAVLSTARRRRTPAVTQVAALAVPYATQVALMDELLADLNGEQWNAPIPNHGTIRDLVTHLTTNDTPVAHLMGLSPSTPPPAPPSPPRNPATPAPAPTGPPRDPATADHEPAGQELAAPAFAPASTSQEPTDPPRAATPSSTTDRPEPPNGPKPDATSLPAIDGTPASPNHAAPPEAPPTPAAPPASAAALLPYAAGEALGLAAAPNGALPPEAVGGSLVGGVSVHRRWREQAGRLLERVSGCADVLLDVELELAGTRPARGPLRHALVQRTFETWTHADDIRTATGRHRTNPPPGHVRMIAELGLALLPRALKGPRRDVSATIMLTGPGGGTWTIPLSPTPARVSVVISADAVDFCRLLANRWPPNAFPYAAEGDTALAHDLVRAAATLGCD